MTHLFDMWRSSLAQYPERIAVTDGTAYIDYQSLGVQINSFALALQKMGVTEGTKVAFLLPNELNFLPIFFATLKLQAIPCPLNVNLTQRELEQLIELIQPDVLITSALKLSVLVNKLSHIPVMTIADSQISPPEVPISSHPVEAALADVACVLCTSGTTGIPKAGLLTHDNLTLNLHAFQELLGRWPDKQWQDHEIFGNVIPLFHPYGLIMMTLMPLFLGGTVVLIPRFTPESCLSAIAEQKITFFGGVPSMYAMFNKYRQIAQFEIASCNHWICGGAPLANAVRQEFKAKFGINIHEGFGMLETASIATLNFDEPPGHEGSVGPFIKGMEAQIRDDQGKTLPDGQVGELWLTGHNIFKGYYNNPIATANTIKDGWLKTGDLAYLDGDRYLYIMGRIKDLMIVGGHNVYPQEVETVLLEDKAIADAAVVAKDNPVRGEQIFAFVVTVNGQNIDEPALLKYCRQHLSAYKIPRKIYVVPSIPRNASGKVLRRQLVATALK